MALCALVLATTNLAGLPQAGSASLLRAHAMLAEGNFGGALRLASAWAEAARSSLEPSLERSRLLHLQVAGEAADALRLEETAFQLHHDAVVVAQRLAGRDGPVGFTDQRRLLQAWSALADSLRARGNHSAAVRAVAMAQQSLLSLEKMQRRKLPEFRAAVGLLAADVSDCSGDAHEALAHFEAAIPEPRPAHPSAARTDGVPQKPDSRLAPARSLSRHLALLGRSAAMFQRAGRQTEAKALWKRWSNVASAGVTSGLVPSVWQAPGSWEPGLLSRPWHSIGRRSGWNHAATRHMLGRIKNILAAATAALREEWKTLRHGRGASRQSECLHYLSDPLAGTDQAAHGMPQLVPEWRQYSASGYWHDEESGRTNAIETSALADWAAALAGVAPDRIRLPWPCSRGSPVLCAVTAALATAAYGSRAEGDAPAGPAGQPPAIRVLRAGYSELGPRTSLRAHHGRTNRQLKMHLGIDAPSPTAAEQRALRRRAHAGSQVPPAGLNCSRSSCWQLNTVGSNPCLPTSPSCAVQPVAATDPWVSGEVAETHCAALRVAGADDARSLPDAIVSKWRPWENGKVLFFDDSFLHEVANVCSRPRVIVQVVLRHPLLKD